jgi:NAD(P)-dependent dehydrogenase (short-subunit alcohol dehydrogenase family)
MPMPVALITGAARGLGRALAVKFSREGWQVIATDIDFSGTEGESLGENYRNLLMDVTSGNSVKDAFEWVKNEFQTLDLIVNNAGIDRYFPFSEAPLEVFREVFEINLFGAYRVNRAFIPLLKRPGGRIIQIGSESLNLILPFMPYPISKNAVERYAKSLRQEMKFAGIDVVVVRPGPVRTMLLEKVHSIDYPVNDPVLRQAFGNFTASAPSGIGNVSEPEEVARFVYRISCKPNPRAVYRINNGFLLKLVKFVPFSLLEKLIARRLRIH